jgi:hypothetical protein
MQRNGRTVEATDNRPMKQRKSESFLMHLRYDLFQASSTQNNKQAKWLKSFQLMQILKDSVMKTGSTCLN